MPGNATAMGACAGRVRAAVLAMAALVLLPPAEARSQSDGDPVTLGTWRVVRSTVLGEDRLLQVHLPQEYAPEGPAYPVIYVFYSDWVEGYFTQLVNDLYHLSMDRMPPAILVGVPNTQRYRDLLPWPRERALGEEGRADRFLRFVREELIPVVDAEYRTKPFRVMVGPQAAAVFGLYTLLEAPGTFQAFVLNDPCMVDHAERGLCRELPAFARSERARGTYFAVSHDASGGPGSLQALEALRSELESGAVDGFRWRIQVDPAWPFFLSPVQAREALLELFRDYPYPSPGSAPSLAEILAHYDAASRDLGFELEPPDLVLTLAANGQMERGDHAAALETFRHLVELYPSSLNGPWGLANLHRVMGDTATAIRYYEECLRRDPDMGPAQEWIRRLKGGGPS
ncbi:MAG: tetratricopeptide repeat protein [Gemmatimonadetes bacterium]|nr:tetratricopeptide repeat protein [Gemmatimonadota bacterium]